jgi:hypothetical protein
MLIFLILSQFLWAGTSLEGPWKQPCANLTVREEAFQGPSVTLLEQYFQNATCTQPFLSFENRGHYALPAVGQMDFTFEHVFLTPQADAIVNDLNSRQVCGFTDWALNKTVEITGLRCALFAQGQVQQIPKAGDQRFGIYQVEEKKEGDLLYFGRLTHEQDALSPEKRPQELDPRGYVREN